MSRSKKTIDVLIMGRNYKVACDDDEREDLLAAVELLDRKMVDIKGVGKVASAERIAVMAALNLANELLQARKSGGSVDMEGVRRRMQDMQATLDEALEQQERLL
jgi:cell division protein ZapA